LQADVTGCERDGLVIGADHVTLDLNGHTVSGRLRTVVTNEQCEESPEGFLECQPCGQPGEVHCGPPFKTPQGEYRHFEETELANQGDGVADAGGFDHVTIRNGRIENFNFSPHQENPELSELGGVSLVGVTDFHISGLKTDRSIAEGTCSLVTPCISPTVSLQDSSKGVVKDIEGWVAVSKGSEDNLIQNVGIGGCRRGECAGGLVLIAGDRNTLLGGAASPPSHVGEGTEVEISGDRNTVQGSEGRIFLYGAANIVEDANLRGFKPLWVFGRNNVVRSNQASSALEPIFIRGASGTLVEDNVLSGAEEGTYAITLIESDHNVVRRNTVQKAVLLPDGSPDGGGIILCKSGYNTVEENEISSGFVGINLGVDVSCPETGLAANVIRGNRISGIRGDRKGIERTGDGILIGTLATRTLVEANTVSGSSNNGIDTESASTTLRRNYVAFNRNWGIAAPFGAVDGGGNRARGNGQAAQCQAVVCHGAGEENLGEGAQGESRQEGGAEDEAARSR
jgi:hypothetical protein